jgi:hypothetical protein
MFEFLFSSRRTEGELKDLSPSFVGSGLKLGGEFEFLGTANKGQDSFDASPPNGVVKLYHLGSDVKMDCVDGGTPDRCGFYRCSRLRWNAFKRASTAWDGFTSWGKYDTIGEYPIAYTIVRPNKEESKKFFSRLVKSA